MVYEISVSEDQRCVRVRVHEPITRELARAFNREMAETAAAHGIDRFLFDMRQARNVESALSNYEMAYHDAEEVGYRRDARYAVLHDPQDTSHEFIQVVALNAGYTLKLFTEEKEAEAWLRNAPFRETLP